MVVKGKHSSPSKDSVLGPLVVAFALYSQIKVQEIQGGACYNPAVAFALLVFDTI